MSYKYLKYYLCHGETTSVSSSDIPRFNAISAGVVGHC